MPSETDSTAMSSPQSINAAKASTNANNDALVQDILSNYIGLEILHPVIQNMSEDPNFKAMFWKALGHDYAVIGNRSQDLSDCEITATQKAFKKLMDDKNHVAAVEIYVDEIIGINTVSENLKAQCLATAIQTRDHIMSRTCDQRSDLSDFVTNCLRQQWPMNRQFHPLVRLKTVVTPMMTLHLQVPSLTMIASVPPVAATMECHVSAPLLTRTHWLQTTFTRICSCQVLVMPR